MLTTALQTAEYIEKNKYISGEMQLQKLLYYSQAWTLAWTGRPLFSDEIQAWIGGPVVASVWSMNKYGGFASDEPPLDDDSKAIVDAVYDFYGGSGGAVLSERTHGEEPWIEARGDLGHTMISSRPISQSTMRRCYSRHAIEGQETPKRPLRTINAPVSAVAAATKRQRAQWREALDELATR